MTTSNFMELDFSSEDAALRSIRSAMHELDVPGQEMRDSVTRQALQEYVATRINPHVDPYTEGYTVQPEDVSMYVSKRYASHSDVFQMSKRESLRARIAAAVEALRLI